MTTKPWIPAFDVLPWRERLHVRARLLSAPLEVLAARAPAGRVADVGCGHGLLTALLALGRPDRHVIAIDPDERKINWAGRALAGQPNVELRCGTVDQLLPQYRHALDAVVVADVLYLLPVAQWSGFLRSCALLLKPGGRLLLKEVEADFSWKHYKSLLQEVLMVRLLKRTRGGGSLSLRPREYLHALIASCGLQTLHTLPLGAGYTTPHVLYEAAAPSAEATPVA